ncbi:uncharacterized protein LOC109704017 [Ananas comosus]|uniref:Uncharacterized protein LOC109704017 n=1 Tax=Ananas comosus TaxID=4615 RepID=A0A6P5EFR2_ANACO|nr:uncharacterized protein LOC109704017 [Ananas comosus]
MEEELILNSATMESDGNVVDVYDVHDGQLYKTQGDFKRVLKAYAMKRGLEYAPTKCNDLKIIARYRVTNYPWRIKVVANEKYTLKMVQTEILRQHGVKISYWKAYRARERILQEVCGDFEGSFAALSLYMRELRSGDAQACLQLLYQDEGRFHRFFWAFGALIRAFRKHCRPLIGMDGTFLHYYATFIPLFYYVAILGALLIMSCIDGNNCILLLEWAVVEGENHYSWHWFLDQLRDGVVGDRDVSRANSVFAIIFDRQKGLIEAVSDVFPDAAHSYCMYHLSTNLPHAPKNTPAWRRFWAAARAYTVAEFNEHMEKMKELNPEQYKKDIRELQGSVPLLHAEPFDQCPISGWRLISAAKGEFMGCNPST